MRFRKMTSMLLAFAFFAAALSGCSGGTEEASEQPGTTPSSSAEDGQGDSTNGEKVTLTGFGCSYPGQAPWEEMPFFIEMEKRTNIHIEWEYLEQNAQTTERVNMMFASNETPDLFIRAGQGAANRTTVLKWAEAGQILDLAPYLDEYAPNIKAMFDKYPAARSSNITPDGNIYVLPTIYDYKPYQVWRTMQINTAWLENVGKEEPTTLDEFTDVLRAFRDQDANGNGDPTDEIPYSAHDFTVTLRGILPGFGLNYVYNLPCTFDEDRFNNMVTSDEFKQALEYCNLLYSEGLLDPEIFSQTNSRFHGYLPDNRFGVVMLHQTLNAGDVAPDLKGLAPLIGPAGADKRVWSCYNPVVNNNCSAFITSSCKDPFSAIRWLDYLYSEEGSDLVWLGIEGETYEENEDGTFSYLPKIAEDERGFSAAMGDYSIIWGNGSEPGCFTARQLEPGLSLSTVIENEERVDPFLQDIATTPLPIMTSEQETQYKMLTQEIDTYKNEMWAKFVTGEVGFDKWDEYVNQLEALGMNELTELIQNVTGLK